MNIFHVEFNALQKLAFYKDVLMQQTIHGYFYERTENS